MTWPLICGHSSDGIAWLRICGYGIHWKDTTKWRLLFSERNRLTCGFSFGRWYFGFLNKDFPQ